MKVIEGGVHIFIYSYTKPYLPLLIYYDNLTLLTHPPPHTCIQRSKVPTVYMNMNIYAGGCRSWA